MNPFSYEFLKAERPQPHGLNLLNKNAQRYIFKSHRGDFCAHRRIALEQGISDFSVQQHYPEGLLSLLPEFLVQDSGGGGPENVHSLQTLRWLRSCWGTHFEGLVRQLGCLEVSLVGLLRFYHCHVHKSIFIF